MVGCCTGCVLRLDRWSDVDLPNRLVLDVLGWVWPPALLGLVVLMIIGSHRRLCSRTREWLVYPLLVALTLAALGGGHETVQESIDASDHSASAPMLPPPKSHSGCCHVGSDRKPPELARLFSPVRYPVQAEGRQNPNHIRAGRSPIDAAYSQAPR